jgi:superfamily I DNA/RNA helicase
MQEYAFLCKPSYLNDRNKLSPEVQRKVLKCETLLSSNPRHPSLQAKKLQSQDDVFEARVDQHHRLLYACSGEILQLLAVGPHDIIESRIRVPPLPESVAQLTAGPDLLSPPAEARRHPPYLESAAQPGDAQERREEPLSSPIDTPMLEALGIAADWQPVLTACATEDDLLDAAVPPDILQRVIDHMYPAPLRQIQEEPNLVVAKAEDLQRHSDGQLIGFLLQLDPEQEAAVKRALNGPSMIRGGPGTGKSTVALYRVKALIDRALERGEAPPRILFTTFTNALIEFSRQLLDGLLREHMRHVRVSSIDSIAMEILTAAGRCPQVLTPTMQAAALAHARQVVDTGGLQRLEDKLARAGLEAVRDDYLLEEFEWVIEGRGVDSLDEYLTADRRGRGYGFDQNTRRLTWECYAAYRQYLDKRGALSWKLIERTALESVRQNPASSLSWDHVIIDEAQDLAPVGLALAAELCSDPRGIVFAADGCQSIYHKGFRFSHLREGIELRGRSTVLKRNYRSTREVALATVQIISGTESEGRDLLIPDAVHSGERPTLIIASSPDQQLSLLAKDVKSVAVRLRLPISMLAILCPSNRIAEWCGRALRGYGIRAEYVTGGDLRLDSPNAKVMTIQTAKGLEFPMVAVVRVEEGELPRTLPPGSEDVEEHLNTERRLLFVGCTRAMRKLWVTTTRQDASRFLQVLDADCWSTIASR